LAREAVEAEPEPYRTAAFPIVLQHLLRERGSTAGAARADSEPAPRGHSVALGMQLNEFLATKAPKSHPDRLTSIAYYYYHERGNQAISISDIVEAYARARIKKPQNISDVIGSCVRRGHLIDTDKKDGAKAWLITKAGEVHVEEGFRT